MATKNIFAILSLVFGFGVFLPYYINIWKKVAKPHLFSWITWTLIGGLGFVLSYRGGGGEGSWIFGLQTILCLGVAVYALFKGEKNISFFDWIAFSGVIIAAIVYVSTKNAVLSVILAATIDFLGFIPTFRKSYLKPYDEPILTYFFAFLSWFFSIVALENYSFVTMFYPFTLTLTNIVFVLFLLDSQGKIDKGRIKELN